MSWDAMSMWMRYCCKKIHHEMGRTVLYGEGTSLLDQVGGQLCTIQDRELVAPVERRIALDAYTEVPGGSIAVFEFDPSCVQAALHHRSDELLELPAPRVPAAPALLFSSSN